MSCKYCRGRSVADIWVNEQGYLCCEYDEMTYGRSTEPINYCPICGRKLSKGGHPMTRYEQIKQMSVEEMAKFMADIRDSHPAEYCGYSNRGGRGC